MDTNLKDERKRKMSKNGAKLLSTSWGTLLMILILAVISVGVYAPIKDYTIKYGMDDYLESRDFVDLLVDLTAHIHRTEFKRESLNNFMYNNFYYNNSNMKNIKYYIAGGTEHTVASNIPEGSLEKEINESRFYLEVKIDHKGDPEVINAPIWFDKSFFVNQLIRLQNSQKLQSIDKNSVDEQSIQLQDSRKMQNLDIIYTVPRLLSSHEDILTDSMISANIHENIVLIFIIGGIGMLILTILAFGIPFSLQEKVGIVRVFNSIYLELRLLICLLLLSFNVVMVPAVSNTRHYGIYNSLYYTNIIYDANWYFYAIGIPVTFLLYVLVYLCIVNIKNVYNKGFKEGIIKNTASYAIVKNIKNLASNIIVDIIDSENTAEYSGKILALLGLNLLAIYMIKVTGTLGFLLAIVYTIILFNYGKKVFDKVRMLSNASGLLAKGDFAMVVPENMGLLSPFAKNLNSIKDVFMTAVREETKSQNMKTQLITNVSHDLKTPLTSIITYTDLLKNPQLDEENRQEYIEILDVKSKRLKVLIDDLFEVSKAVSGDVELNFEEVDVVALLRQTLGELDEKINESNLQMRINLPEDKILCQLDGRKTYRIFENIIGNILKYTMENTRVYIDVIETQNQAKFVFKNISSYEMNFEPSEIMERFARGDSSRSAEGSGLGLAIAKSLSELQKGILDISIDGDLFKLTVTFPKKAA